MNQKDRRHVIQKGEKKTAGKATAVRKNIQRYVSPFIRGVVETARKHPDMLAIAAAAGWNWDGSARYVTKTFSELNRDCTRVTRGLMKAGITKDMHVVLMVTPGPELFTIFLALLNMGAIPVLVDPGMGMKNLKKCLEEAEPEAFIGVTKAHIARLVLRWAAKTNRINITVGKRAPWGGFTYAQVWDLGSDVPYVVEGLTEDSMAMIAFTSGNTGIPKGVVYTHRAFTALFDILKNVYKIGPGDIDLSTFPVFALFGPACGFGSVIPDMDASRPGASDPRKLVAAIHDFKCTNMFASPAIIEIIGRYCDEKKIMLPSIRKVASAGAPARLPSIERLLKYFNPGVQIFTPYGATEALPITFIGSTELLATKKRNKEGGGNCVGKPIEGLDVAIIAITEDPIETWSEKLRLPPGKIGEICVRGPIVTRLYYNRPVQTRLAKIRHADGDMWHRMGDVGYLDRSGRLWMCGRKTHRVETRNGPMFTLPCEAIFNNHPGVGRSALVGVQKDGETVPVICIELNRDARRGSRDLEKMTRELLDIAAKHEHTKSITSVLYHPRFPVDVRHNAKIVREMLTAWAMLK